MVSPHLPPASPLLSRPLSPSKIQVQIRRILSIELASRVLERHVPLWPFARRLRTLVAAPYAPVVPLFDLGLHLGFL